MVPGPRVHRIPHISEILRCFSGTREPFNLLSPWPLLMLNFGGCGRAWMPYSGVFHG